MSLHHCAHDNLPKRCVVIGTCLSERDAQMGRNVSDRWVHRDTDHADHSLNYYSQVVYSTGLIHIRKSNSEKPLQNWTAFLDDC